MTWLSNLFNNNNNNAKNSNNNAKAETTDKEVYFQIVNESAQPIGVKIFNEDPEEINESDSDSGSVDSEFLNGHEPISFHRSLPVGERWFYRSTTCPYADNHVGTVAVESSETTYFVDANKILTLPEGKDPSSLITHQAADPFAKKRSEEEEEVTAQVIPTPELIVVKVLVSNGDESENDFRAKLRKNWMSQRTLDTQISDLEASITTKPIRRSAQLLDSSPLESSRSHSLKRQKSLRKHKPSQLKRQQSSRQKKELGRSSSKRSVQKNSTDSDAKPARMERRSATPMIEFQRQSSKRSVKKSTSDPEKKSGRMERRSATPLVEFRREASKRRVQKSSSAEVEVNPAEAKPARSMERRSATPLIEFRREASKRKMHKSSSKLQKTSPKLEVKPARMARRAAAPSIVAMAKAA